MRVTGTRTYYRPSPPKMPPGLVELMEGLTREVLKNNPTDINGFCANHFQHLLEIRDGPPLRKSLSLKEKIAIAQEKVRQRAEKRRQQYDALLLKQQSNNTVNAEVMTGKDTLLSLPQEAADDNMHILNNPIHHEHTLIKSSEVEISHGFETKIHTTSAEQHINNKESAEVHNTLTTKMGTEVNENNNETEKVINELENFKKAPVESSINPALIENEQSAINIDKNSKNYITTNEVVSNLEDHSINKQFGVDENIITNKQTDKSKVKPTDITKESSLNEQRNLDRAGIAKQNDTTEITDVKTPQKVEDQFNIMIGTEPLSTGETTDHIIHNKENIDSENLEDCKISNSFDVCVNEAPSMELQSSPKPDALKSLQAAHTDIDLSTLVTPDSCNYESMHQNIDVSNTNNSKTIDSTNNIEAEETESNLSTCCEEEQFNHMDVINSKNADIISNTDSKSNQEAGESGYDTSTTLETQSNSNQDTNTMDLETAAVTIQKVFRTFLFKSRASTFDDSVNVETLFIDEDEKTKEECIFPVAGAKNIERRPHGLTRMDTVLQTVNEEKSLSLSTDDSSTLSSAATVIQAHVRGFLVRNKLNSNKTTSTNSLAATSTEPSLNSMEIDNEQNKNKTILNIHIVPEGNYLSRDESLITSMELSLDSSPPSSINLHPLGSGITERRKQLKREDAIQSVSPPSNNSGKLSEDVDSVKELSLSDRAVSTETQIESCSSVRDTQEENTHEEHKAQEDNVDEAKINHDEKLECVTNSNVENLSTDLAHTVAIGSLEVDSANKKLTKMNSDEMDVVTPYSDNNNASDAKLLHSGEFHDAVLPTKVSRSDTSVASEFKNVLVYFLLWNHS